MRKTTLRVRWLILALALLVGLSWAAGTQTFSIFIGETTEVPYGVLPDIDGDIGSDWNDAAQKRVRISAESGESFWTDVYLMHDDEYLGCALEFDTRSEFAETFRAWTFIDNGDSVVWNVGDDIIIVPESNGHTSATPIDYYYPEAGSFSLDSSQDAVAVGGWNRFTRSYIFEFKIKMRSRDFADVFFEPCNTFQFFVGFDVVSGNSYLDEGFAKLMIHPMIRELYSGCSVDPATYDFGTLAVGETAWTMISVTNTGLTQLTVSHAENCAEFTVSPATLSLVPQATGYFTVMYAPSDAGSDQCLITLSTPCDPVIVTGAATAGCPDSSCACPPKLTEDEVSMRVLEAKRCIDAAAAVCLDNTPIHPSYVTYLQQADAVWQEMTVDEKLDLLTLIGQERLGDTICFRLDSPDPVVANGARVTADGNTIIMTWGGMWLGLDNRPGNDLSPLDSVAQWNTYFNTYYPNVPMADRPEPPRLIDGWYGSTYSSVLHFFCYELEVVRIRHYINCFCKHPTAKDLIYSVMSEVAADIPFYTNHDRQVEAYHKFMSLIRERFGDGAYGWGGLPFNYFASWMFEHILANGGVLPDSCDMSLDADGPLSMYQENVGEELAELFEHDIDARAVGDINCTCCGCATSRPTHAEYEI